MASTAPGITKRSNSYYLDPKVIKRVEGWNARIDFGDIDSLAESIKAELLRDPPSGGLLQDLHVRRNGEIYELIDGDRRLTAIEQLMADGIPFPVGVPVKIVDAKMSLVDATIRMITTNTGKPLHPIEEAAAFKRLRDQGMTLQEICRRCGRAIPHVTGCLKILESPDLVDAVQKGEVGITLAKSIVEATAGEERAELVKEAKAAGKDQKKKRVVVGKVAKAKKAKAKKAGRIMKARLTDAEVSTLGAAMSAQLEKLLRLLEGQTAENLLAFIPEDPELACAFTLGALQALKAAAGLEIDLSIDAGIPSDGADPVMDMADKIVEAFVGEGA